MHHWSWLPVAPAYNKGAIVASSAIEFFAIPAQSHQFQQIRRRDFVEAFNLLPSTLVARLGQADYQPVSANVPGQQVSG